MNGDLKQGRMRGQRDMQATAGASAAGLFFFSELHCWVMVPMDQVDGNLMAPAQERQQAAGIFPLLSPRIGGVSSSNEDVPLTLAHEHLFASPSLSRARKMDK